MTTPGHPQGQGIHVPLLARGQVVRRDHRLLDLGPPQRELLVQVERDGETGPGQCETGIGVEGRSEAACGAVAEAKEGADAPIIGIDRGAR